MKAIYGGIEAGGTKMICAVGSGPDDIRDEIRFPFSTPQETLGRAVEFFRAHHRKAPLAAIGVASFGPVDPIPTSPTFGHVMNTPKPGWSHTDVVRILSSALGLPVGFDTDVNGAALGEARWGAARGLDTFVYMTVGTGIGGGAMINGKLLHGLRHAEMGHMWVPHDHNTDPFPGNCPYHGDCLEGLACGPALAARWGQDPATLPEDHPAWTVEARYLGYGLANIVMILSPQRIVLGGGVMDQAHLLPMVRRETVSALCNYVQTPSITTAEIDSFIVAAELGGRAGVLGAIALAREAYSRQSASSASAGENPR